jgi:lipid-A-disaccharide synthase
MIKKFFIIAGEASGDLLGSKIINEIKLQLPQSDFIGVGGKLMKESGLKSIFPMEDLSVMGFLEVLPHIPKLIKRINFTTQEIIDQKPDYIITIDSPDFCFRVIKKINNLTKAKKIHLIAPSVWAYREGRAKKISKLYDLLLAILPFEPPYFEKYGLKTIFIGHPIVEDAPDFAQKKIINSNFRSSKKIKESDIIIYLTPGSRVGEVKKIFPEFIGAINLLSKEFSNLKIIIPFVERTKNTIEQMSKNLQVEYFLIDNFEKKDAMFSANYALAKSGTNTIEISLYKIPMIIAYKVNFITYLILKVLVKIKYANLINLIMNKEVITEMLQTDCEPKKLFLKLRELISKNNIAELQIKNSQEALKIMGLGSKDNAIKKSIKAILN